MRHKRVPQIQISVTARALGTGNLLLDTPVSVKSNLFDGVGLAFLAGSVFGSL